MYPDMQKIIFLPVAWGRATVTYWKNKKRQLITPVFWS